VSQIEPKRCIVRLASGVLEARERPEPARDLAEAEAAHRELAHCIGLEL
jgi:hypothetical protein